MTPFLCLLATLAQLALSLPPLDVTLALQEQRYRERQVLDPKAQQWVEQAAPGAPEPGDAIAQARALLMEKKAAKARSILRKWLKANPDDERFYEAKLLLGDTWFLSGDYWKAVKEYEDVAENSAGELFEAANLGCMDVARAFLAGKRRIVFRVLRLPAYDEGIELLDKIWERMPGTRLGELAIKLKADYYYNRGDFDFAQDEYANLAQQYPSGRFLQLAMLRSAQSAEAAFPGIRHDDAALIQADERYRQLKNIFPAFADQQQVDQRLEGIRQTRADKDLAIARWYEHMDRGGAAEFYYRRLIRDWAGTLAATEARSRLQALGALEDESEEVIR